VARTRNAPLTRRVLYSVAMSLDGYIDGPQGEYDWIPMDPEIDFGAMFKRFDTVLMGRRSWEAAQGQGGGGMPGMAAVVCSRTLRAADVKGAALSADPAATLAELKRKPGKDIWLFGGGALFRSLLDQRLVDAVEIGLVPVLLGGGIPMLPHPAERANLKLTRHRIYEKTGTVMLEYAVT
jgi:dihydrofolate reductase